MSCSICCSDFNKSTRKAITCPSGCDFVCCKECVRKYLVSTTRDPHCMNCSALFGYRFCSEHLNKSFMTNDYAEHRSTILLEKEISMIPDTMEIAGRRRMINDIRKKQLVIDEKRNKLYEAVRELNKQDDRYNEEIYALERSNGSGQRRKFIMACPGESCRGFLSSQYKCEICCLWTCNKCSTIIGDSKDVPHECSEDAVASTDLIRESTKPCPTCGIRITKISGCDQMWCVECKTAFSWKTGVIETGVVHNPHFFEYRGTNPRDGGRGLGMCNNDNVMPFHDFNNIIIRPLNVFFANNDEPIPKQISDMRYIYALYAHMNHYELMAARANIQALTNNEHERVRYILGEITIDEFKAVVTSRDRRRRRIVESSNVTEIYCEVSKDILNSIVNFPTPNMDDLVDLVKHIYECYAQLEKIRDYCNRQWMEISAVHGIKTHRITDEFSIDFKKCGIRELMATRED